MKRSFVFFALSILPASVAISQTVVVSKAFDTTAARSRWTPLALAGARYMPLPRVEPDLRSRLEKPAVAKAAPNDEFEEHFASHAEAPTLSDREAAQFHQRLFDFTAEELRSLRGQGGEPEPALEEKNYGTGGLDYTSSRLIPSEAIVEWPFRAVGRLFFSDGTDNFVCTASVINRRLVVTAGHCVHDGPGKGFFQDFLFVPAYRNGDAPFGSWAVTTAFVTDDWAASAEIPHPHDFALLEMEDQNDSRIADVVGALTFQANLLADNHLTLFGYAGNLDDGEELHQVSSGDYFAFDDGTVAYGSDMGGGSSGGPWVQNFNRKAQGQSGGRNRARLAVVGVTSYGFTNDAIRAQGASNFDRMFKVLRQEACFNQEGNC